MAGGFKENAYATNINLSKKLSGETVIYVYDKDEYFALNKTETPDEESSTKEDVVCICECPEVDISSCLGNGSSIIESEDNTSLGKEEMNKAEDNKIESESLININTATIEEFMTLSGIGEAKAKKIIEYRNEKGLFKATEDIKNVSGISDGVYEKIKDNITI